ncbi:MAG: hypothetical protein C4584_02550 [Armatimonadetes bacterium]|nr:MAG: hypothetical protein C4584_02550 [Armatimonadota bacterium]
MTFEFYHLYPSYCILQLFREENVFLQGDLLRSGGGITLSRLIPIKQGYSKKGIYFLLCD